MTELQPELVAQEGGRSEASVSGGLGADVMALSKPGIVKMVLITTGVGFALAALERGGWSWGGLALAGLWCFLGTMLSAAGANGLNQAMEARRDGLMNRTRRRPIPAGRMSVPMGIGIGTVMAMGGVGILWAGNNSVAALVSLVTVLLYVFVYTPMKPVTPLATLVGAAPGALPPLIGWTAGWGREVSVWAGGWGVSGGWRGLDHSGGWSLFALMFVWQVPHFLAIAWRCRADYERGGYKMLPIIDPTGARTAWVSLLWAVTLIPVSLATVLAMPDRFGWLFVVVATMAGAGFVVSAARLVARRTDRRASELFFASIIYLPVVLVAMVTDVFFTALR